MSGKKNFVGTLRSMTESDRWDAIDERMQKICNLIRDSEEFTDVADRTRASDWAVDDYEVKSIDCEEDECIVVVGFSASGDADEDWFALTAAAADVGKVVHVITSAGDPNTDTIADVFASDCTTSLGGPSDDSEFHSDFKSSPIPAAGTYFVKVAASPDGTTGKFYNVSIALE